MLEVLLGLSKLLLIVLDEAVRDGVGDEPFVKQPQEHFGWPGILRWEAESGRKEGEETGRFFDYSETFIIV